MQLPRGTFRAIKKNETVESILEELISAHFSGICSISSGPAHGSLVFRTGKCILAEFEGKPGDRGWDELQKIISQKGDAALSSLDDAQIQLSLEFNKACRVARAGKPVPAPAVQHPAPALHREPVAKPPVSRPEAPLRPGTQSRTVTPARQQPVTPRAAAAGPAAPVPEPKPPRPAAPPLSRAAPPPQPRKVQPPSREEDLSWEESGNDGHEPDTDTYEWMDIEDVTDKIRNDCQIVIRQLHLEHLMER